LDLETIKHVKKNNSKLHLMGLISNGKSPHTSTEHILELLKLARKNKINNTILHIFTDGRDSYIKKGLELVKKLQKKLKEKESIATISGRFYAMDRKGNWQRTEKAYNVLIGEDKNNCDDIGELFSQNYKKNTTDEFIEPTKVKDEKNEKRINDNDGVIFFNLRADRGAQLSKIFTQNDFEKNNPSTLIKQKKIKNISFATMTDFGLNDKNILVAYKSVKIKDSLPKILKNIKQVYMAESEKYAHVTYFFNGGNHKKVDGENYWMIESTKVKTYDKTPKMRTEELTNEILKNIKNNKYDFTVVNFAAPDMIGHTANIDASIECCECVDTNVKKIVEAYLTHSGTVIITADHGNVEELINYETDKENTKHTTNEVPFILINEGLKHIKLRKNGKLANITPTILDLLNIKKSKMMCDGLIIK